MTPSSADRDPSTPWPGAVPPARTTPASRGWRLSWLRGGAGSRAVLFLHGGSPHATRATGSWQLPVLSVALLARSCARRLPPEVSVATLRFSRRGWNHATAPDPVLDLREVLDGFAVPLGPGSTGLPTPSPEVTLVGHSMGGRAALWAAATRPVARLVLLAPWLEAGDPLPGPATRQVVVVHGTADRVTSSTRSSELVRRLLAERGVGEFVPLARASHCLVDAWSGWTRAICEAVSAAPPPPSPAPPRPARPSAGP